MAQIETWLKTDLKQIVKVQELDGQLFTADNQANLIGVVVTDKGSPATLTGNVSGYIIRSDGETVIVNGTLTENKAYIVLPASAYVKAGPIHIVIKVGTTTIGACTGYMGQSTTDTIVDPGRVIPSLAELLEQIGNCRTATTAANTAAEDANEAAESAEEATEAANTAASSASAAAAAAGAVIDAANSAATNANTKAGLADAAATAANSAAATANSAASAANTAADSADASAALADQKAALADQKAGLADTAATNANTKAGLADAAATDANAAAAAAEAAAESIDDMTVAANGLPAGSTPTVVISDVDGHKHILFGMVKGDAGKDFHIRKTFASIAAMQAYDPDQDQSASKVTPNDFVMIDTGSVQDPDTGKLFCYEPDTQDIWRYIGDLSGSQGIKGETGTGISSATLNADYTLTIAFDDGTSYTTPSIRGATGETGPVGPAAHIHIRYSENLPMQDADMSTTPNNWLGIYYGTSETAPTSYTSYNWFKIKGETGSAENIYATTVPMSEQDQTTVAAAIGNKLNSNQGSSNAGKFMKVGVDGSVTPEQVDVDISGKADKVANATTGNFAGLDSNGNLTDSGKKASDFLDANQGSANEGKFMRVGATGAVSYEYPIERYSSISNFPETGDLAKVYIAENTGKTYIWDASDGYVIIDEPHIYYGTSLTTYAQAMKRVTVNPDFYSPSDIPEGTMLVVKFPYGNTISVNVTLNINDGGTVSVKATNGKNNSLLWGINEYVIFVYVDSQWVVFRDGVMDGATSIINGLSGLVPAPSAGDQDKVLSGAGTWVTTFNKTYDTIPEAFHEKEWEGSLNNFGGNLVWTDGTDFYYSGGAISQYILNKNTGEWESQVWQGYTAIIGNDVWTDGTDIYYSNGTPQYVLDKATSTWTAKTWTGLEENLFGDYIWTDGTDIYYSYGSSQYVLDKATSTWSAKTWTGLTVFYGCYVWTDGVYIYYSNETSQYVLDKATSTWSAKTWTGLTSFFGTKIWMNGSNVYYSYNATQYVLNRATSTWSQKTWTGLTSFDGEKIWTDGALIYYSLGSTQYVLTSGDSTGVPFGTNGEFEKVTLEEFKKQASAVLMPSTAFSIPSEGNTVAYLMDGMTADYQLVRWNFSSSSENCPPASLQWKTAPGCFAITNVSGTTDETIQPVFVRATTSTITEYT